MKKKDNQSKIAASGRSSGQDLRQRAEKIAREKASQLPENMETLSHDEMRRTLHELLVHQIQLEMQNEELRKTQTELDNARMRYFSLYDLAPMGYCTISENGQILEANLTAATMLGVSRDTLGKQSVSRFILKEDQDIYYLHIKQLFETNEPQSFELRMAKKDGKPFWVQLAATITQDDDGTPVSRVVLNNIAKRKHAEEALKESEQRLIEAQSIARLGRWDLDRINGGLQWSNGIFELFEIDPHKNKASYEAFLEVIHPDDREMVDQAHINSFKSRTPCEIKHRLLMNDGRIKWIHEICRTEYDKQGQAVRTIGIVQDITELKVIDDAQLFLLQFGYAVPYEDFFKSLANYLADALGIEFICIDRLENDCLTAQTVAIYCDGKYKDNISYTLKDTPCGSVVGKTICSFPKDVRHLFPNDHVLREMAAESYIGTTLFSTTGLPIGLIAMISRKPMENMKLAESLLKLVSIRAASELERRQYEKELIKAKEEAEASNILKSTFLANMSHEIRTPMGGVIGMINAVLSTELTDEQYEFLNLAKTASGILLKVVNDILDYSKIEAERVKLEKSLFSINLLVNEVIDLFSVSAKQKRLNIFANINRDIPENLIGDPMRMRQILSNLIGNAIKFTDKGSVTISVRKIKSHDKKVILQFDIEDTGIGMPEENLNKLFKSFSQLDNSSTRQFGGTGLGLVISKKLVEMMGGKIWVSSKLGIGSTFSCTAIFESAENPQTDSQQIKEDLTEIQRDAARKYMVLLAEDEEINRKVAIYFLQKMGCHVIAAANGKEAIELFEKCEIDLILMDVQMPEMDGFSATKQIRQLESFKNKSIPIIAITAYALKGDKEKCIEAGMDDYLMKPINPEELHEKLDKWLKVDQFSFRRI